MSRIEVLEARELDAPAAASPRPRRWLSKLLTQFVRRGTPESLHFQLDSPGPGERAVGHVLPLSGWACSPRERVRAVIVEAGSEVQRLEIRLPRQDVAAAYPYAVGAPLFGFRGVVSTLGLPSEAELTLSALLESGARVPVRTLRITRRPLVAAAHEGMRPLLLYSFGRSGTSWTMHLLREHPQVVVAGSFPHEVRAGQYWARLAHLLSQPLPAGADPRPEWAWTPFEPRCHRGPEVPETGAWFGGDYVEGLVASMRERTQEYYARVGRHLGRQRPLFFAEKAGHLFTLKLMQEFYPDARLVFLVRDFRDMFCSIRSFNARRGVAMFGREAVASDEDFIARLGRDVAGYRRTMIEHGPDAPLLRYEDLIRRPHETLARLFAALGLDAGRGVIDGVIARASAETEGSDTHRTTRTQEESIGRWRRDLSAAERQALHKALGGLLEAFGYGDDAACRLAA